MLQNKAARIVIGFKARQMSTIDLLNHMNWISIENLIKLRISCLVHQIIHIKKPEYLYEILINQNKSNTRSNLGNKLGNKPSNI